MDVLLVYVFLHTGPEVLFMMDLFYIYCLSLIHSTPKWKRVSQHKSYSVSGQKSLKHLQYLLLRKVPKS